MAFTVQEFQQPGRWTHFSFFVSGGTNGAVTESLENPGQQKFKLGELRLHFSTAVASATDLVVRVSSINGSYHNAVLLSLALLGLRDVLLQFSNPYQLLSDDQVVIGWSQKSGVNIGGLNVQGWAVLG